VSASPRRAPETGALRLAGRTVWLTHYLHRSVYACDRLRMRRGAGSETVESLWFPAFHHLICLVNDRWIVMDESCGLPVTAFQSVAFDDEGRLWVGTRDHGLYRSTTPLTVAAIDSLTRIPFPFPPGEGTGVFGDEIVSAIFEPVWSESNGAPSNQLDRILWRDGVMWAGTPAGLFALEGNPPRVSASVTPLQGLPADNATSMAFSPATGTLWVGTNGGLCEVDPQTPAVRRVVTRQDGLVDNEVWFLMSVAVSDEGTVYFGTAKGLALYAPQLDVPNVLEPRVCFRRIFFTEDNSGNNEIAIEYAALSYANEKRVRYRTRLVGYDRDWSSETADFKTRYTNLGAFLFPKTYTFEVSACNSDGVWTATPLRHTFEVQPAWWIRWWSMLSQAVLLVAGVLVTNEYRTRALARRNRELEAVVDARTKEVRAQAQTLQEQNVELEEKNAQIIRTQQQLIVQEKLASLGQLTAGIAHEIRNPLNFVNNFAQLSDDLIEELREDIAKHREKLPADTVDNIEAILSDLGQNLTRINEHGKRADGIVQGMLMHSRGQKGERGATKINALLDESAALAYHGLRAGDPTMNVVFEKHYDETAGEISAIPEDLGRVFLNVVNNACYAVNQRRAKSPAGYVPTISLSTKNLGGEVEIRIRDNGTGMPEAVRDKVFNPFFTTKPTGQGTGLGMSLSYDIVVQAHKGTIRVESEEGSFTEFIIVLPRA
jgi:signal transduction histidine kinase